MREANDVHLKRLLMSMGDNSARQSSQVLVLIPISHNCLVPTNKAPTNLDLGCVLGALLSFGLQLLELLHRHVGWRRLADVVQSGSFCKTNVRITAWFSSCFMALPAVTIFSLSIVTSSLPPPTWLCWLFVPY